MGQIAETSKAPVINLSLEALTLPRWRGARLVSALVLLTTPLASESTGSGQEIGPISPTLHNEIAGSLPAHWEKKVTVFPLGDAYGAVDGVKLSLKGLSRGDVFVWKVDLSRAETFLYAGDKKGSSRSLGAMTDFDRPPDGRTVLVTNALFFARKAKIPLGDFKARDFKSGDYIVSPASWGNSSLAKLLKSRSYLAIPARDIYGDPVAAPKNGTLKDLKKEVLDSGLTLTKFLAPYEVLIGGGFELSGLPMESASGFFKALDTKYGRVNRSTPSNGLDGRLRRSRTVLGVKGSDLYIVTFGADGGKRSGASLYEAGRFMNDILKTQFSMSVDGGSSTTFWYQPNLKGGKVVTNCKSGATIHPSWLVVKVSDDIVASASTDTMTMRTHRP